MKLSKLSQLSKASAITLLLLTNTALAESYQSFSALTYSQSKITTNEPVLDSHSKWQSDNITLFSQYYFDEQLALGPLNEFNYINTSSNVYAAISNSNTDSFSSRSDGDFNWENSNNTVDVGGQWISHNFILGVGYSYTDYENTVATYNYDNSDSYYSAELGYLISDDFVISAYYNDGGDGDDFFAYSASYALQLAGTDYIGFTYDVDEDFDIHQLSARYFFGIAEQSYMVLGGDYTIDNRDNLIDDDDWSVNASYYYDQRTSVSAFYGEGDYYGLGASYFINHNYSVQAGYNSVADDVDSFELDGYYLSVSAQF